MATLIGDFGGADYSSFHSRVSSSAIAQPLGQTSEPSPPPSSSSQHGQLPSRLHQQSAHAAPATSHPSAAQPQSPPLSSPSSSSNLPIVSTANHQHAPSSPSASTPVAAPGSKTTSAAVAAASRFPTPPDSSLPNSAHRSPLQRDGIVVMAPTETEISRTAPAAPASTITSTPSTSSESSSTSSIATVVPAPPSAARPPPPTNAIPSPASDGGLVWPQQTRDDAISVPVVPSPAGNLPATEAPRTQQTIRIRDLGHIQRLAQLDMSTGNGPGILNDPPLQDMKFEISGMPIADIIEMVAALLTKITTTNDHQHDALHRNASQQRQAQAHNDGSDSHSSPFSTSVLAFHGKNVPAITILSYLSRIHKYCPTTYEVFLSLLVYFDRMTERINELVMRDEEERRRKAEQHEARNSQQPQDSRMSSAQPSRLRSEADVTMRDGDADTDESRVVDETDEDLADTDDDDDHEMAPASAVAGTPHPATVHPLSSADPAASLMATYFVVDSFNIHRLIIAGVTCASKFFSDVFYTNSRYAKVGGLPLAELNHLELQFLILNDFRLAIPIEDLEAYATMLVEFYAREVVGQRPRPSV